MSNVNNFLFAKHLDQFKIRVIDPQVKRIEDAKKIMDNPDYKWDSPEQKASGEVKLKNYKDWLAFYQAFHDQGMTLCTQHESLTNKMSKIYDSWYENISNEGKQEVELMSSQADLLCELMGELYKELLPLKLKGMKPPHGINL